MKFIVFLHKSYYLLYRVFTGAYAFVQVIQSCNGLARVSSMRFYPPRLMFLLSVVDGCISVLARLQRFDIFRPRWRCLPGYIVGVTAFAIYNFALGRLMLVTED